MSGPLTGLRVVELAGVGPGPYAAMLLADLGADVVRVQRPGPGFDPFGDDAGPDFSLRNRTVVAADLADSAHRQGVHDLLRYADVLIEGFRPGVAEKLGVGPRDAEKFNAALIYARMTGWGQTGPWHRSAGHDINYISITGALHAIGTRGTRPTVPLNLLGDFAGGAMFLVVGILAALWDRERSGLGQVVDAAIVDGVTSLLQQIWSLRAAEIWSDQPADNLLDSAAPFYDTYACRDGGYVAVGAIEPKFFAETLRALNLDGALLADQYDRSRWPHLREQLASRFITRTRDEWAAAFDGTDACVTPVLSLDETHRHPHLVHRASHVTLEGVAQSSVAPRFSRNRPSTPRAPHLEPEEIDNVVQRWRAERTVQSPASPAPTAKSGS